MNQGSGMRVLAANKDQKNQFFVNLLSALAKAQLSHKALVSPHQNGFLFLQALPNEHLAMPLSEAAGIGSTHMPPALRDSHRTQQC